MSLRDSRPKNNMANITLTKEFKDRHELENWVRGHCGTRADKNTEHTLELSPEEMTKLSLGESDTVFGVRIQKAAAEAVKKTK